MSPVRVRQHVNPLSQKYQRPVILPPWERIYAKPTQPLLLDIGCARGRFLYQLAPLQPDWNHLGLEIREPLVEEANRWRDEVGLTNLHYLFCNANRDLDAILASLPSGVLRRVAIQFPDPWFKKRHQKRRVVQPELVDAIVAHLVPGGEVVLQSDVEDVARQMCDRFGERPEFDRPHPHGLPENPFPIATEREIATFNKGKPVYRAAFVRRSPVDGGK
ncbi:MAG TPA: tRNA (guanosine(46)-N7)-methyltransferase TrmB [Oscillatoriales cyanobacterium M59_W2019_021]|nr:tRNA (guanosine(46)-N7)-methyltransferase TrmB [Oscillatoriales cyanobacterium M4454_W2019_049]HIK50792.1 tRNA (guanosine(46)-N7)-methyltransferase TrmB [Oscillatoriales cyanobacterium M59_W2019_021]